MKRSTVVGYRMGSGIGDNPSVGLLVGGVQCGHVACGVCGAVGVWWGFGGCLCMTITNVDSFKTIIIDF